MSEMQAEAVEPVYCEGIQLLLQRMESHPKEFEIDSGKWGATMRVVYERVMGKSKTNNVIPEPWLTQEEVYVVWCKYKQIKQQEFHEFVMKKLFGEEKDDRMDAYAISQGKQRLQGSPTSNIAVTVKSALGIK